MNATTGSGRDFMSGSALLVELQHGSHDAPLLV
jgi:hypothetical protein